MAQTCHFQKSLCRSQNDFNWETCHMCLPWTGKSSWRPALASTWQVCSCEPARSARGIRQELWQSYTLGRLLREGAEHIIMGFSEHIDTMIPSWTELNYTFAGRLLPLLSVVPDQLGTAPSAAAWHSLTHGDLAQSCIFFLTLCSQTGQFNLPLHCTINQQINQWVNNRSRTGCMAERLDK